MSKKKYSRVQSKENLRYLRETLGFENKRPTEQIRQPKKLTQPIIAALLFTICAFAIYKLFT